MLFEAGPTELDRDVQADPQADARRKLLNRLKFSAESIPLNRISIWQQDVALRDARKAWQGASV